MSTSSDVCPAARSLDIITNANNNDNAVEEVTTTKTPDGKEVKTPTVYSDYKEVNGVKFPHAIGIKSGPMNLDFVVQEIKVNEGVSDADFK